MWPDYSCIVGGDFNIGHADVAKNGVRAILEMAPAALVIDVGIGPGPTLTYRREEISARPEAILAAIRQAPARPDLGTVPILKAPPRVTVGS